MKKVIIYISFVMLFVGCHKHHEHNHEHSGHNHDCDSGTLIPSNAIHFHESQQAKIDFETTIPIIEPFGQVIRTTAQIQSSQADETIVSARTSGIVLFSGNNLTEGQAVNTNQALFSVSGSGLAENNSNVRFVEAQNKYKQAESDYKRAQELIKNKIISEKDFLLAEGEYETTKAVYDNLYRNFSSQGQRVSASFSGYIKQIFVENGQFVEEGQALISLSKNKTLLLKADVQPKYASVLPFVSSATVRSMNKVFTYSLEELNGRILSFGKSLNNENYLLPVTIQIDNKAGFIPGGFVEVYLKAQSEQAVMTVPSSALTEEQGNYFVYVQLTHETFEKREVSIGATDGIRVEILSGLDKEEKVVSKGAISVKLAQSAGILDPHAGHAH